MILKGAKMARLGSITSYRQVKSGSRVNYALISDFLFCGKGACC